MVRTKKKGTRRVSLMFSTHSEVLGDLLSIGDGDGDGDEDMEKQKI